jgi:glycine dehydrogenase
MSRPAAPRTPLVYLENAAEFHARHIGPRPGDEALMLSVIGAASRAALMQQLVPAAIVRSQPMALPPASLPAKEACRP